MPAPARRALQLLAAALAVLAFAGCGADDGSGGETTTTVVDGPRVANPRFEGKFVVTEVETGNKTETFGLLPVITIETMFGGLTVEPGCNTHFGSFTLDEDGTASFTIAGDTGDDCGELNAQEALVIDSLTEVEAWTETQEEFRFDGPEGSLSVRRP